MPDKRQVATRKRRRPRDTNPWVVLEVRRLALEGYTAAEIHRGFPDDPDRPSVRTIYRIIEDVRPPDPSGTWKPLQSPVSAGLVLPILAAVVEVTSGRRAHLTNDEAGRVEALRDAAPDLPPWETYVLARAYIGCDFQKKDSGPLDMVLAFAPWRSTEHSERYFAALNRGWVQEADLFALQFAASTAAATSPDGIPSQCVPETWSFCQRLFSAVKGADEVTPKDVEALLQAAKYGGNLKPIPNPYGALAQEG